MKKKILILLALILVLPIVYGCEKNPYEGKNVIVVDPIEDISEYTVIRGENCTENEKDIAVKLRKAIGDVVGQTLKMSTDYTSSSSKEILVGTTTRKESLEAASGLKLQDFVIKKYGEKLVIIGGSDAALEAAVDFFLENFVDNNNKLVKAPRDNGYIYRGDYAVENLTINNCDFSTFKVLNNSFLSSDDICENLESNFGVSFEVAEESVDGGHYIVIEATEVDIYNYSIETVDGNLVITGSDLSIPGAIDAFANMLKAKNKKTYDLSEKDDIEGSIKRLSFYSKEQAMSVLEQVYNDSSVIIVGEQVQNGRINAVKKSLGNFYNETGEYPGIIGIDLGCYNFKLMGEGGDDIYISHFLSSIADYASKGGLVTISSHTINPSGNYPDEDNLCRGTLGNFKSKEECEKAFSDLVTEGTALNTTFKAELIRDGEFLAALRDLGIPVIFRPFHEMNGNWFWFCVTQGEYTVDASYFVALWKYMYQYYTVDLGLDNLIWNYGPNISSNNENHSGSAMSTVFAYPGDEYCDMVGVDWYTSGNLEIANGESYLRLIDHSRKIGALNEFGPNAGVGGEDTYSCMSIYNDLISLKQQGYSFAYILTWGGSQWSVATFGRGEDFMNTDMTLGLEDVRAMLANSK